MQLRRMTDMAHLRDRYCRQFGALHRVAIAGSEQYVKGVGSPAELLFADKRIHGLESFQVNATRYDVDFVARNGTAQRLDQMPRHDDYAIGCSRCSSRTIHSVL